VAVAVATVDLTEKALDSGAVHHLRSPGALLVMLAVALALLLVVPRLPSPTVALGAGIAAGGAFGNLVSGLVWWGRGIPDPLVVHGLAGGVAFNLADVGVFVGDALLLCAAVLYALRSRDALRRPA
jgi:lipoprotein signal peptidase